MLHTVPLNLFFLLLFSIVFAIFWHRCDSRVSEAVEMPAAAMCRIRPPLMRQHAIPETFDTVRI